jgi:transcriptional regulator with XRE-family HTH domain
MSMLGQRWKEAREAAGFGMNELDRLIGQRSGYTSRVEADGKPEITMYVVDRAARVLGVRLDWLATGDGPRERDHEPTIEPDQVNDTIARVVRAKGYPFEVAIEASRARGLTGTASISEEDADELVELTRSFLRSAKRIAPTTIVSDAGTDNPLDDLGGGIGETKGRGRRR